eukprot:scaffold120182_cov14-Tisochrysis_lutea.AAC.1
MAESRIHHHAPSQPAVIHSVPHSPLSVSLCVDSTAFKASQCSYIFWGGMQIDEGESCEGQCYPTTRNLTSAAFTSSGRSVLVDLNARAKTLDRPCSQIFDSDTMSRLGSSGCIINEDVSCSELLDSGTISRLASSSCVVSEMRGDKRRNELLGQHPGAALL